MILDGHDSHISTEFMWECFSNNIHLLFLPAHTSDVLQPLDLSVFSPLKHTYRKLLNQLTSWSETTALGKQLMLRCLVRARREAITAHNIKAGWKAFGLWPLSMAKPLMSPLLLKYSNRVLDKDDPLQLPQTPASRLPSQLTPIAQGVEIQTPRKRTEPGTKILLHNGFYTGRLRRLLMRRTSNWLACNRKTRL